MRLLTISDAASRLGMKPATIRFWIWTRKIDYVKVGRAVRIREDTIDKIVADGTVPALIDPRITGKSIPNAHLNCYRNEITTRK